MSLLIAIEKCWTKQAENDVKKWINALDANKDALIDAGKKFHEWYPLQVYLSVSKAMDPRISFSLRYQGQEVAIVKVKDGIPNLKIPHKTAETNKAFFGIDTVGEFEWNGAEARKFRKVFMNMDPDKKGRIDEHRIEAEFLRQMSNTTRSKFSETLAEIQPVLLADCPFQFPVPISGNKGVPRTTRGNIDILARRGTGKGTKISIWELKKPDTTAHAIEQAYIYAVTLLKMLRTDHGDLWYKEIIGFKGSVPSKLIIESVVAVSFSNENKKLEFVAKMKKFKENNSLQIGNDSIRLLMAHYKQNPLKVELIAI